MEELSDEAIIKSWRKNARSWINAIKNNEIISRVEVTNNAILNLVLSYKPSNLLDIGCGEGWLIRELSRSKITCTGMDVVPDFSECVERAGGVFKLLSYEEFGTESFDENFDLIVCNFSLLGKESVENIINSSAKILTAKGTLLIQTIHPVESSDPDNYVDGWRKGNWQGFGEVFTDPAPWYFRTLESWQALIKQAGFGNLKITEPFHPQKGEKMSVIFEATK